MNLVKATRKRKDRGDRESKGSFGNSHILSPIEPASCNSTNRILAGYMAHEFLTTGKLFGQKFDPGRVEPVRVEIKQTNQSYAEVAQLLKGDAGAHIPGIINPTQLARWIQM